MNAQAVAERSDESRELAPQVVAASPMMAMLSQAVQAGQSIEIIRELMAMSKELAADEARRAFDAALAQAKGEIPVINKNKAVGFTSKKAGASSTSYRHEDLGEIVRTVDPILKNHGLAYRFVPEQNGAAVKVTCVLSHIGGHSERFSLSAGSDNTGNKNSIQAVGSTLTYLQRYTLKMALGLAASADDDGRASEEDPTITDEQVDQLNDALEALIDWNEADAAVTRFNFLKFMKVETLADIPADKFKSAVAAINATKVKK